MNISTGIKYSISLRRRRLRRTTCAPSRVEFNRPMNTYFHYASAFVRLVYVCVYGCVRVSLYSIHLYTPWFCVCAYVLRCPCVWMPVYLCVWLSVRMYACIHVCMSVLVYVCLTWKIYLSVGKCAWICLCICVHFHAWLCVFVPLCIYLYISVCVYILLSVCMCICVRGPVYTPVHLCACVCVSACLHASRCSLCPSVPGALRSVPSSVDTGLFDISQRNDCIQTQHL